MIQMDCKWVVVCKAMGYNHKGATVLCESGVAVLLWGFYRGIVSITVGLM